MNGLTREASLYGTPRLSPEPEETGAVDEDAAGGVVVLVGTATGVVVGFTSVANVVGITAGTEEGMLTSTLRSGALEGAAAGEGDGDGEGVGVGATGAGELEDGFSMRTAALAAGVVAAGVEAGGAGALVEGAGGHSTVTMSVMVTVVNQSSVTVTSSRFLLWNC